MKTENLSTLKIHKLSQKQYDRELAAGRIDGNALYLTPDEEIVFPVESVNGKTGSIELSASDVGAASKSELDILSESLNAKTTDLVYSGDEEVSGSISVNADTLGGKLPSEFAPAGFITGYNEVASLAELQSLLINLYNSLGEWKQDYRIIIVTSTSMPLPSDYWICESTKIGSSYIKVVMSNGGHTISFSVNGNGLSTWEWTNPPMNIGVEYRTTERYKGKAVYTKLLDFGTLLSSGVKSLTVGGATEWVDLDVIFSDGNMSTGGQHKSENTLYINNEVYARVYFTFNSICIQSVKDCSHDTATAVVKYTKD